ncbi:hypothetical protein [Clostridium perfringens]|uniref:hypothetical protein n=1 Tax=Clostridium perfringens TaxID=1502 RepID=UPI0024BD0DB1|nr:hypothetical protein [Clostridium perfringens]
MSGKETNEVFIGARSLDYEQVKLILPTYDSLQNQIEEIRKSAELNDKNTYKQYNNTISIFGRRGTGKTSILFTIIEKLKKDSHKNIILPKIEPDTYSNTTKILGAILRFLKTELDETNKKIFNIGYCKELEGFFKYCKFNENNSLTIAYNELMEYYCYMNEEYRDILIKNYSNIRSYSEKYSYILAPDYEFNLKFNKFIEELVKAKKYINNKNNKVDKNDEPLIFIIIDDIDLKTTKCKELIDTVLSYICNKNLVCFLSGDEDILNEAITLSLLDNENMANKSTYFFENPIFDMNLLERKKELTRDYLKKALPPAFRHNVVNWNLVNIPKFSFKKLSEVGLLGEILHENFCEGDISIFKNSLFKNDKSLSEYTFIPYYVFDKTPRGLINIFYYLNKYNGIKERSFEVKKAFIDTIISSTNELSQYKNEIYNNYIIWANSEENTVINFSLLYNNYKDLCDKNIENKNKVRKKTKKKYLRNYILLIITSEILNNSEIIRSEECKDKEEFYKIYEQNISNNTIEFSKDGSNNSIIAREYISEILRYSDFKFSLMLFENLKYIEDEDLIFIIINKLLDNFKNFNYLKEWIKNREQYEHINKFLIERVSKIDEHREIKELLFNYEYKVTDKSEEYSKIKNVAFYNYILNNNLENEEYKYDKNKTLFVKLDKYNILKNEDKFKDRMDKLEHKLGEDILKYFNEKLNNIDKVKLYDKKVIEEYCHSAKNRRPNTLFYNAGIEVEQLKSENISIEIYSEIYKKVKSLSINNKAWYGVYESIELLSALNKYVILDLDYIDNNSDDVKEKEEVKSMVNKILKVRTKEKKYAELTEYRNNFRNKMKIVYKEIEEEEESFAKGAGYTLEDFEYKIVKGSN